MATDVELSWLAGLLEGEGCFYLGKRKNKNGTPRPLITIVLGMTDEDVVRRAHSIAGSGNVSLRPPRAQDKPHYKPAWIWSDSDALRVRPLLELVLPHMGERRSAQIRLMLAATEGFRPIRVHEHGSRRMYDKGCTCVVCRAGNAKRHREYLAQRRARQSPA